MMTTCPNGHESTTADYCDQCGAKLEGAAPRPSSPAAPDAPAVAGAPVGGASAAPGSGCPNCQSPHGPHDKFCEVCGYDFIAGTLPVAPVPVPADPGVSASAAQGTPAVAPLPAENAAGSAVIAGPAASAGEMGGSASGGSAWRAVVCADRAYYDSIGSTDMSFPDHCPEREFALTSDEILIGRRSESRGIHPQIDLSGAPEDTGISRSHAILRRQDDGSFVVIDPGSTNGTMVNDDPQPLAHNVEVPVKDGDRIYLGGWTKIMLLAPSGH